MGTRRNTAIDDVLWEAVKARAMDEGRPLCAVVNDALVAYLMTPAKYLYSSPDTSLERPFRDAQDPAIVRRVPAAVLPFVSGPIPGPDPEAKPGPDTELGRSEAGSVLLR